MDSYDFSKFSPPEFQDFARDLVQIREGICFESFAEGADQGIDNRYIDEQGECTILQVKRWSTGGLHLSELKREKEKLDCLEKKPNRYILVLAIDVSPVKKGQIKELFAPYILHEKDIIFKRDLDNYLQDPSGKYKSVAQKYLKILIPTTEALKQMLQNTLHSAFWKNPVWSWRAS